MRDIKTWRHENREGRCDNCGWPIRSGQEYERQVVYRGNQRGFIHIHWPACPVTVAMRKQRKIEAAPQPKPRRKNGRRVPRVEPTGVKSCVEPTGG